MGAGGEDEDVLEETEVEGALEADRPLRAERDLVQQQDRAFSRGPPRLQGTNELDEIAVRADVTDIEGEIGDRIRIANEKFKTFQEVVKKVNVYAAKDASRGGWFGNLLEMMVKSQTGFKITSVPYPSYGRYMGNYMTCVDEKDIDKIVEIASEFGCPVTPMGEVTEKKEVVLGKKKLVNEKKMLELIRKTPFKKPKI